MSIHLEHVMAFIAILAVLIAAIISAIHKDLDREASYNQRPYQPPITLESLHATD